MKSCAVISKTTNRCTNETKHLEMNIGDTRLNTACYRKHAYYYEHRVASADYVNCPTDDYYRPDNNSVYEKYYQEHSNLNNNDANYGNIGYFRLHLLVSFVI